MIYVLYEKGGLAMLLIWKYLKKYKKLLILNMISVFGFALVELGLPTIIANMIDYGVSTHNQSYLYSMWFLSIIISILGVGGTILLGFCCAKYFYFNYKRYS